MLALSIVTTGFTGSMVQSRTVNMRASISMAVAGAVQTLAPPTGFEWGMAFAFDPDGGMVSLDKAASTGWSFEQGLEVIEARNSAQHGLKIATLKREGNAAVEARQQTQRELTVAALLKVIERRNSAQHGLKIATLKREGLAAVETRDKTQKIATLKREGRLTVEVRQQTQERLMGLR